MKKLRGFIFGICFFGNSLIAASWASGEPLCAARVGDGEDFYGFLLDNEVINLPVPPFSKPVVILGNVEFNGSGQTVLFKNGCIIASGATLTIRNGVTLEVRSEDGNVPGAILFQDSSRLFIDNAAFKFTSKDELKLKPGKIQFCGKCCVIGDLPINAKDADNIELLPGASIEFIN
jgi:hypothetical protein